MTNRLTLNSGIVIATLWLTTVVHAQVSLVYALSYHAWNKPEIFGPGLSERIVEGLLKCFAWPWHVLFNDLNGTWMHVMLTGYLIVAYGPISMLWCSKVKWLKLVPAMLAFVIVGLFLSEMAQSRIPGFYMVFRMTILLCVTGVGLLMARLQKKMNENYVPKKEKTTSRPSRRKTRVDLGFTLIEVLIVITIILILAAIIVAVFARSKNSALVTREIQQMRQIYIAINLYEMDYDMKSPRMLSDLDGAYLDMKYLTCPTDERHNLNRDTWPSNPWIMSEKYDALELVNAQSPFMNSYFYFRTFEGRADNGLLWKGLTFDELRSDPAVGLIAGSGLLRCSGTCLNTQKCIGGCEYPIRPGKPWTEGHPALNMSGKIVVVRTDGSFDVRVRPENCSPGDLGYKQLFLGGSLDCSTPVGLGAP